MLVTADDASFLLNPAAASGVVQVAQMRIYYIPFCHHGSAMITTRSKIKALKLVYETETLLESTLGQPHLDNLQLAQALDCMPLAFSVFLTW